MSRSFKVTITIILFLFLSIVVAYGFRQYLSYLDQPIVQARQLLPLDGTIDYKIVTTNIGEDSEPFVYGIIRLKEPESSAGLAWRKVGQSSVDLRNYLNRPVRIYGEYYIGTPLPAIPVDTDNPTLQHYFQEQVVIRINDIELVE